MTVTPQQIRDLPSGEFSSLSDGSIQPFIDESVRQLNAALLGERLDDATKYLAAHLLATMIDGSKAPAGAVIAERAGPLARSFAGVNAKADSELDATTYGRRYRSIVRLAAGGPVVG